MADCDTIRMVFIFHFYYSGYFMFNQKHNTFHFFVQTGKYYSLNIARGKIVISIEISKRDAFNEPLLNQFVNNFLNDLDFRKRLTLAADPLNTSGFVDIDIGRSFLHFGSLSEEISSLVDKEKEGKAVEEDYLNLRIRSDKFSKMNEKALSLFVPKKRYYVAVAQRFNLLFLLHFLIFYVRKVRIVNDKTKINFGKCA